MVKFKCLFVFLFSANVSLGQTLILADIDSLNEEYIQLFRSYAITVKNANKHIVFVNINTGSKTDRLCMNAPIHNDTKLLFRVVSMMDYSSELFDNGVYGSNTRIVGKFNLGKFYPNLSVIDFVIVSNNEPCEIDYSKKTGIFFDDYHFIGPPTHFWSILKYRDRLYVEWDGTP